MFCRVRNFLQMSLGHVVSILIFLIKKYIKSNVEKFFLQFFNIINFIIYSATSSFHLSLLFKKGRKCCLIVRS